MIEEIIRQCTEGVTNLQQNIYWTEGLIYRTVAASLTLYLFIVWRRGKALLMYQAWALFYFFLNLTLIYHDIFGVLSRNGRLTISIAFFLNNLIVVYRSWQYSEKYIPKRKLKRMKKTSTNRTHIENLILARGIALWVTLRHGGNDAKNVNKVKRDLSKRLNIST